MPECTALVRFRKALMRQCLDLSLFDEVTFQLKAKSNEGEDRHWQGADDVAWFEIGMTQFDLRLVCLHRGARMVNSSIRRP